LIVMDSRDRYRGLNLIQEIILSIIVSSLILLLLLLVLSLISTSSKRLLTSLLSDCLLGTSVLAHVNLDLFYLVGHGWSHKLFGE